MLGMVARVLIGMTLGVLFVLAVAFALAADSLERRGKSARNGTADTSAASLQRVPPLVRART